MNVAEFLIIFLIIGLLAVWVSAWTQNDDKLKNKWVGPNMSVLGVFVATTILYLIANR